MTMVQTTRIQQGPSALQTRGPAGAASSAGRINGIAVQVLDSEIDVDDQILVERFKRDTGIEGSVDRKQLSERQLGLAERGKGLDGSATARLARAFGNNKASSRLAQSYLQAFLGKETRPKRDANASELANHFVALQKLAEALRGSDDDFVARMTPLKEGSGTLSELAAKLREAGDDAKAMQELLSDVEGMPEEQEQLGSLMKTLRFQPDQLKRKLRDSQKLPDPDARTRQELLEAVDDELQELQRQHGSHFRAIDHALRNAGDQATAGLAESYAELVHDERASFARTLEKLVSRHPPGELRRQIIPLMEKTLANELGLGEDQRSIDSVKLEALLTELAHIHISATLLDKMSNLVTSMNRQYTVSLPVRQFDEQGLLMGLLKTISGGWISPANFDRMAKDFNIPDGGPTIFFLTGLMQVIRELPFKVFDDDAARSALLDALQAAIDAAINREETALDTIPPPTTDS